MTKSAVIIVMIMLAAATATAAATPRPWESARYQLSADDRKAVLTQSFAVVRTTDQIPPAVLKELAHINHTAQFDMANPGQSFNATDVIVRAAPSRRLVFAAVNSGYCIVHYEHGGIAYNCPIAIVKLDHGKAHLVGFFLAFEPLSDFIKLRSAISSSKIVKADIANL